jgi:hypothetical protein
MSVCDIRARRHRGAPLLAGLDYIDAIVLEEAGRDKVANRTHWFQFGSRADEVRREISKGTKTGAFFKICKGLLIQAFDSLQRVPVQYAIDSRREPICIVTRIMGQEGNPRCQSRLLVDQR